MTRLGLRRLGISVVALALALAAAPAWAATSQFTALLDLDDNPATGCTVMTVNGPFTGVEQMLVTTVDLGQTPPKVVSVTHQACVTPATSTFGPPIAITSPTAPPWAVGVGNGTAASDVIETYLPLTGLTVGAKIRLGFTAVLTGNPISQSDATLTTNDLAGGPPIILNAAPIAAVPTLGGIGLLLLVVLLAGGGLLVLRRRPGTRNGTAALLLLLTLGAGLGWSAIVPDGTITDWNGIPPIATDATGDAPVNADLLAEFATIQNNILYLRYDARLSGTPSVLSTTPANGASGVSGTTQVTITFNEPVKVTATSFKLECPINTPVPFTVSPAPPGNAATFTLTPSAPLPAGTTCKVSVIATQVTDAASGLPMAANYPFSFTTDTAPTVTSTAPANGATSVPASTTVAVTFSKAVTAPAAAFKLECPTGTPQAFTVSPSSGSATTFTLTPSSSLPLGVTCTATVVAAQVADGAGTHLAANFTFSFTIDTAPTVTSITPANGATSVPANTTVAVTFSKAVTAPPAAFKLECPTGTPEAFTVSPPSGSATTFTLTPSSNLPLGATCTATVVAAQVSDSVGTHLAANFVSSFTVDTAPTVTSTTPAGGATNVPPNTTVSITFSKAVNVTASAFKIECPVGTPQTFTVSPAPPGGATTFTLTPSANLPVSTTCTVTAVAAQISDVAAGTHLAADFVFTFATGNPPTVTTTTPAGGATAVLASTPITINFSQAVTTTATSFKLECPVGTPRAFTVAPPPPGNATSFTLTPSANLPAGVTCTVTVVASQVKNASNVNMAADFVFSFTVDTAPTVTSTAPANGATGVATTSTVSFTFNKAVNVTATAFKLECPTGTPVAFTLAPAPPGGATTFTLTPSAPLPTGTVCTATAVAAQIADLAGTHLAADVPVSFTVDSAPSVTTTTPANGATSVLASTTVTVNFNKAVNVTATAFKLECPTGTPEAFTISPAPPGGATSFTLTPSAPLPAGTTCTATVVASQVTSVSAGTPMAANFVFSFTVDTPPTVTSTSPVNGATNVLASTTVSFTFNKAVNVTATAFKLECPTGTPVAFTLAPAPPGGATTFTLTPSAPLPAGTTCTATAVAAQIADLAGTHLAADVPISFTVDTPPTVTSTSPVNGATNVLASTTVSFTFNKAVNVTATAFKLECPTGTPVAFTLAPAPPGGATTFTLTPSAPLPAGTTCTATAVAAQIADLAGTHLAADVPISFTVETPPTVTTTSPVNGATNVLASTTVSFTFNKAVNVTATAFKLECPTGTPVAFTLAPAPPGGATTFTLTPSAPLPAGTTCTATAVAAQITDLAGTHLAADVLISFTTDSPPTVSSTNPANGATAVLATTTVSFTFNKAVNVTATAFKLECPTGTPVAFTLAPAPPGGATTFTLTPSANLPAGTVCTATAVASQIADLAGTHMAADFAFSFTIDTPPTVTSTNPANGATNVPLNTTVSFTFNKAVNVTATAFKLECPAGTPVAFTLAPAPPGGATTFTLTPSANLPGNTNCVATAVASQIADLAGTHMTADVTDGFKTLIPPPVANPDNFPEIVIGNVSVNTAAAATPFSVIANDTSIVPFTITAFDATSANGGTVSMTLSGAGAGQFTYNPPAGFRGNDTFTYTITNTVGGASAVGTVTVHVAGMIWFINNSASAGDGRLSSPFNTLAAFQAINDGAALHGQTGDSIFLYDSATAYSGPLTLLNNQRVVGQDAGASLSAISGLTPAPSSAPLPATSTTPVNPVVVTSAGNGITVAQNNTVRGLKLHNTTGTALGGATIGTLTVSEASIDNSGTAGRPVNLSNGTLAVLLSLLNSGGGATNGISLATTTGTFEVTGGGASDPTNTTRGRTTAKNGGGTLTLGSGGTITGTTGAGVLLNSAAGVTLRNMVIQNSGGAGLDNGSDGVNATGGGLTLDNVLVSGTAGNNGVHASGTANVSFLHTEASANATNTNMQTTATWIAGTHAWDVRMDNCTGTSTVSNSLFFNSLETIFGVAQGGAASLTLNVTNSEFRDTATTNPGNVGLQVDMTGTATVNLSVDGSTFLRDRSNGVEYLSGNSAGGSATVTNSVFDQNAIDVVVAHGGLGRTVTFDIEGNQMRQTVGGLSNSISVDLGSTSNATTVLSGKVRNNLVGNAAVTSSGSAQGNGIVYSAGGAGTLTSLVQGNTVVQVEGNDAFNLQPFGFTGTLNLTLDSNTFTVHTPSANSGFGLDIIAENSGAGGGTQCYNITNNKATGNPAVVGVGMELLTGSGTPTVELQGYGGATGNTGQIQTFIDGTNTISPPPASIGTTPGTMKAAPSPCPTPP